MQAGGVFRCPSGLSCYYLKYVWHNYCNDLCFMPAAHLQFSETLQVFDIGERISDTRFTLEDMEKNLHFGCK